jgi:hypothetical protein
MRFVFWTFLFITKRILHTDLVIPYTHLMFFFLYISWYSLYFYSNLHYTNIVIIVFFLLNFID